MEETMVMESIAQESAPQPELTVTTALNMISGATPLPDCEDGSACERMRAVTETFAHVDTSRFIKKKRGLSYLSWSKAWDIVLEHYPDAQFDIMMFNGRPYMALPGGVMVWTSVSIEGVTRYMWLPVLDVSMKPVTEEEMDAAQLNKAIMRCLVKNLGMFRLGLNLYNGEDLPGEVAKDKKKLDEGIRRVLTLGQKLAATHKDEMKRIISELNGGSNNPYEIPDVATCDAIIAALEELANEQN